MIEGVLVKLEEYSPYQAPDSFTADSTLGGKIQPVRSYVENTIDEAIKEAIAMLPLRFLFGDIVNDTANNKANVDTDGIGRIKVPADVVRLVELRFADWERGVIRPIDRTSPEYEVQRNPFTRGGFSKPAVVWTEEQGSEIWECYSLEKSDVPYTEEPVKCAYIPFTGELANDRAAEYAIIICAIKVHSIYGNNANVKLLQDDMSAMLQIDSINL